MLNLYEMILKKKCSTPLEVKRRSKKMMAAGKSIM